MIRIFSRRGHRFYNSSLCLPTTFQVIAKAQLAAQVGLLRFGREPTHLIMIYRLRLPAVCRATQAGAIQGIIYCDAVRFMILQLSAMGSGKIAAWPPLTWTLTAIPI